MKSGIFIRHENNLILRLNGKKELQQAQPAI
jgi:hypothetical protein